MSWGEAWRLTLILIRDHTSQLGISVARSTPRLRSQPREGKRRGRTDKPRAEVIEILNAHGHSIAS